MSRTVKVTQMVLAMIAVSLVVTLFMSGMIAGRSMDRPAEAPSVAPSAGAAPSSGDRIPGMPERPIDSVETFETPGSPDRQLGVESTDPVVEFGKSLGNLTQFATQPLDWAECPDSDASQCTRVTVPLDWDDAGGPTIEIAVRRVADGDSSRGALFVNPGGPGAGGQWMAESLAGRWANYDVIGWDPRGTGESTHVVCGDLAETDAYFELDSSPDDAAEDKALQAGAAEFAKQCRMNSGDLLDHISTVDVVRDLDLLRHLLGEEKLNYLGVSYGTYVGAVYAELFPSATGRMILDAAVDITGDEGVPQSAGFELALNNFTSWCAESDLCQLGDDQTQINSDIDSYLKGLDATPKQVGGRELTQTLAATGVARFLYGDESAYRSLAATLGKALAGDGSDLLSAADALNGRAPDGYDTLAYAFPAMACVDGADEGVSPVLKQWKGTFPQAEIMAPHLGTSYTCEKWTAAAEPQFKLTAEGAAPMVVVGTTGDSATPYQQAVSMAEQLEGARLLTLEGAGHGAATGNNGCIASALDEFLLEGKLPAEGTTCS